MRVGIDVSPLVQTRAGTARYLRALLDRNEYEQIGFQACRPLEPDLLVLHRLRVGDHC